MTHPWDTECVDCGHTGTQHYQERVMYEDGQAVDERYWFGQCNSCDCMDFDEPRKHGGK